MKFVKLAGLCLAAIIAVGLVASATASAVPTWKQCVENAGAGTKWETNKCNKVGGTNKFEWKELTTTEAVHSESSLRLTDKKGGLLGGLVEVECIGTAQGSVGPGKFDRTDSITVVQCRNIKGCPEPITAEAVNLPWQTELYETEAGKIRNQIRSTVGGKFPGWKVTCLGIATDTCEADTDTAMNNIQASGSVEAVFDTKGAKANCTRGGAGQGEVWGPVRTWSAAGHAIKVS